MGIVCVTEVKESGRGIIHPTTAFATFEVEYDALVFRPFEGEVLDAVVKNVNKMGFFCEAGPLDIFVSNYMIPEDYEFSSVAGAEVCYKSSSDDSIIQRDQEIRVRIVGKRIDPEELFCIGTIKGDYLGPYQEDISLRALDWHVAERWHHWD